MAVWVILIVVLVPAIYVRLAPSDPGRWHRASSAEGIVQKQYPNGYLWRMEIDGDGAAALAALDGAALSTAHTKVLAGSVASGQTTYITRSLVFGFPDYTTIGIHEAADGTRYLEVWGRLRFGRSDLGVNAKRVRGWLAAAQLG